MACRFDWLAAEQVTAILGFLPAADLFRASAVCQDWAAPDRQAVLWRALVLERWAWVAAGSSNQDMTVPSIGATWKGCFALLHAQSAGAARRKQPVKPTPEAVRKKINQDYEFFITVAHEGSLVMQGPASWIDYGGGTAGEESILIPEPREQPSWSSSWDVGIKNGEPFGCLGELVVCVWVRRKCDAKTALYVMLQRKGTDRLETNQDDSGGVQLNMEFVGVRPAWLDSLMRLDEQLIASSWPTSRTDLSLSEFDNYYHFETKVDSLGPSLPEWGVELQLHFADKCEDEDEDTENSWSSRTYGAAEMGNWSLPIGFDSQEFTFYDNVLHADFVERSLRHVFEWQSVK